MEDFSSEISKMHRKQAESMRQQAQDRAKKRKEEYLGARVSKALRERVLQHAETMNIPASLLIRQILEQAFPASGGGEAVTVATDSSPSTKEMIADAVIAWEDVTLGKTVACHICQHPMQKGDKAKLGLSLDQRKRPILCLSCQDNI